MGKLEKYIKKLAKITPEAQEKALLRIIKENQHILIDIITGQLLNGMDGNGEFLQHYMSKNYAEMKLHLNPKGVTDLRLSGDFWDGFFAVVNKFPIVINSKDKKRDELVKKYGEAIFWPGAEGKTTFTRFIDQQYKQWYRKQLTS